MEKCESKEREKHLTYKREINGVTADFSPETMEARRKWHHIFQVLTEKNCQPRILYPVKSPFRNEREIKTFSNERKLRKF